MWLITQLRVNISRCAAKIQIFSHISIKTLGNLFIFMTV